MENSKGDINAVLALRSTVFCNAIVRTKWHMRGVLDSLFWMSASIPGILAGLGLLWLFLGTPLLRPIFGTIWALILVTLLQGKLTSTQLFKGIFLQMGEELEEASRLSGAGWWRTYFRIWIPLIMPMLVLVHLSPMVEAPYGVDLEKPYPGHEAPPNEGQHGDHSKHGNHGDNQSGCDGLIPSQVNQPRFVRRRHCRVLAPMEEPALNWDDSSDDNKSNTS